MKLEEITTDNLSNVPDIDLIDLKHRATQLFDSSERWREAVGKQVTSLNMPITKNEFFAMYDILFAEISSRKIPFKKTNLDLITLTKRMRGVNTKELPIFMVKEDVVNLTGRYVTNPQKTNVVEVFIDDGILSDDTVRNLEKRIGEMVTAYSDLPVYVVKDAGEVVSPYYIPMYDLMLVPKTATTEKIFEKSDEIIEDVVEIDEDSLVLECIKTKKDKHFIKAEEQRIVGGIVYEVNTEDSQGDLVDSTEEIWKAMETWALTSHVVKLMHRGKPKNCPVIECFQAESNLRKGGQVVPSGAWYITVKVLDDNIWEAVKKGEITGFSMAGSATVSEE